MVEQESLQYTRDLYYGKQKMERNIRDNPWVSWVSEFSSFLVSHKLGVPGLLGPTPLPKRICKRRGLCPRLIQRSSEQAWHYPPPAHRSLTSPRVDSRTLKCHAFLDSY